MGQENIGGAFAHGIATEANSRLNTFNKMQFKRQKTKQTKTF